MHNFRQQNQKTKPTENYTIKPIFKGENSLKAANEAYKSISQYFGNNNPEFIFTLQKIKSKNDIANGKNSDYSHFKISEKRSINN